MKSKDKSKLCELSNCQQSATEMAATDEHGPVGHYCSKHAEMIAESRDPEYVVCCPHCQCRFGVN
jgi:hypothetical protein